MGTVSAYNLASVQAALGGANPISMSEYYRGGAYVPTTRTATIFEPAGGGWASTSVGYWYDVYSSGGKSEPSVYSYSYLVWGGSVVTAGINSQATTSVTVGAYTYYRGPLASGVTYYTRRTSSGTETINTGVPASGAIALSQLYGAANP